jgi:hypothetical protein
MSNSPADIIRRANQVKIAAVLVPEGARPGPSLLATIANPVRLRVRIKQRSRSGGQTAAAKGQQLQADTAQQNGTPPAGGRTSDPNAPVGLTGIPSMAPRGAPRPGQTGSPRPQSPLPANTANSGDAASEAGSPDPESEVSG